MMKRESFMLFLLLSTLQGGAQTVDSLKTKLDKVQHLDEVTIRSRSTEERMNNVQIGQEKITISELVKVPSLLGEHDIIKSLQLLPGIKSESEASSGFEVRGGSSSQNLILLDNATVYQAGHLMGMFSSFNDEALMNATLSKGMIPAQYGDATSAVLDVMTKAGDMQKYHYGATVGLLSTKVYANGPIARDKVSFLLTARRSYADMFTKMTEDYKNTTLYFYDVNGKIDWQVNGRNRLSLTVFHGKDVMGIDDLSDINWKNTSLTLRWMHYFSDKLLSNTNLYFSEYTNFMGMEGFGLDVDMSGHIRHYGLNHHFQWFPSHNLKFNIGLQSVLVDMKTGEWHVGLTNERELRKAWENAVWVNGIWTPLKKLSLSAGVRLNMFSALGGSPYYTLDEQGNILSTDHPKSGSIVKTYTTVEPRFSANYKLSDTQSIKLGYSMSAQNIRAIKYGMMSMPYDRYVMSSNIIKPEMANQISLGYAQSINHDAYDFSLEGYYKDIRNVYDYRNGKTLESEIQMERLLLGGKSRAYGLELGAHKNKGRLTGWLSYTLSWVENKIDGINHNDWYTASNDRRHDITLVAMYKLSPKWEFSASWKYNTGQALTAPSAKYKLGDTYTFYYNERNGYRAPSYHRLDIGATYKIVKAKYTQEWAFGMYNAYGRKNPFIIGFENRNSSPSGIQAYQFSLFSFVPSVSYSIKF